MHPQKGSITDTTTQNSYSLFFFLLQWIYEFVYKTLYHCQDEMVKQSMKHDNVYTNLWTRQAHCRRRDQQDRHELHLDQRHRMYTAIHRPACLHRSLGSDTYLTIAQTNVSLVSNSTDVNYKQTINNNRWLKKTGPLRLTAKICKMPEPISTIFDAL